nr:folate-binding protein YgfZ [Gammaproteobacteria bacterium]
MDADWQSFLIGAGAVFTGARLSHFRDLHEESEAAIAGDVLVDLSHLGLITVGGKDATTFLQGQLTNDIREVSETRAQLSACCSLKGRMLANFLIFSSSDRYFLQLPQELLESILKRLRMFVLRSQVALTDASDTLVRIGLSGWKAHAKLQQTLGALPSTEHDVVQPAPLTVIRMRGERPRYEILGPAATMRRLWTALAEVTCPVGPGAWSLLDIHYGIPALSHETTDAFVPQMINWELLSGVSFTKGCYTGQEIVARTQYLGKIKRRLYRARVHATAAVRPGMALVVMDEQGARSVGQVVNAELQPGDQWDLLAVISTQEAERATIHLHDPQGPALQIASLPYALESRISV